MDSLEEEETVQPWDGDSRTSKVRESVLLFRVGIGAKKAVPRHSGAHIHSVSYAPLQIFSHANWEDVYLDNVYDKVLHLLELSQ